MRKGFSVLALLVAFAALFVAVAAYLRHKGCILCDDLDDDILELCDDDMDYAVDTDVDLGGSAPETAGTDDAAAE